MSHEWQLRTLGEVEGVGLESEGPEGKEDLILYIKVSGYGCVKIAKMAQHGAISCRVSRIGLAEALENSIGLVSGSGTGCGLTSRVNVQEASSDRKYRCPA